MTQSTKLLRTPFYKYHQEYGAKFVEFSGWEMPISYGSIIEEHRHVRSSAGLFDVSHMGRLKFSGRHARRFLERVLSRRISDMKENTCRYSFVCNEQGGVKDDVIIYRFEDHWLLVCNAANRQKLLEHFDANRGDLVFKINDQTESTAMIALQGPKVMDLIGGHSREVPALKRYSFCEKNLLALRMTISRTGYTGEDGVEVILGARMAILAVQVLARGGADAANALRPAGLGARDTLRLEAGMPLYGHELDEETDPISAGLEFAISLDKDQHTTGPQIPRFIGQEALLMIRKRGPAKELVGLKVSGKRTPRQGMDVLMANRLIGQVTSGCLSPILGYPIAMAYVQRDACAVGDAVCVSIASKPVEAEVVSLPFYSRT